MKQVSDLDKWNKMRVELVDQGLKPEVYGDDIEKIDLVFWIAAEAIWQLIGSGKPKPPPPGFKQQDAKRQSVQLSKTHLAYERRDVFVWNVDSVNEK
jgi:hypothetical protein